MKCLSEQTNIEKAKTLHELFPHEIAPLLCFIEEKIKVIKTTPEKITELLATDVTPEKWLELLELINELIDKDFKRLSKESEFFSAHCLKGISVFLLFIASKRTVFATTLNFLKQLNCFLMFKKYRLKLPFAVDIF